MRERGAPRRSVRAAVAVVAIALLLVGPSALVGAATPSWKVVPSANRGTNTNFLYGVSCVVGSTGCEAVGFSTSPGVDKTLVESWNGKTWRIVSSPSPGGVFNFLYGISCISASQCTAVGRYENSSGVNRTLIESGSVFDPSLSLVASPNRGTGPNVLSGVSCAEGGSWCVTVGSWQASGVTRPLVISRISVPPYWGVDKSAPSPAGTTLSSLASVSCVSAYSCVAVGSYQDAQGLSHSLTESWNGAKWSIVPVAHGEPAGSLLSSVSCTAPTRCKAVGSSGTGANGAGGVTRTLIESWNGKAWTIMPSPVVGAAGSLLSGISCTSISKCQAVGSYQQAAGGARSPLAEAWNGSTWKIVSTPNPPAGTTPDNYLGETGTALTGVACAAATFNVAYACKAVGWHADNSGHDRTFALSHG